MHVARAARDTCTTGLKKGPRNVKQGWRAVADWNVVIPIAACGVLAAVWAVALGWMLVGVVFALLIAVVLVGVHHAEVVAVRVGEPFGTLILALAVTIIELALIGSMMISGASTASTLARDTVFATVMIVCNGVVGVCLLAGGLRHHVLEFRIEGASHALVVLAPLTTLALVLPTYTTTTPGPTYSPSQLAFAGVSSLTLYCVFVFVQTVRHRDYFLPVGTDADEEHAAPPHVRWLGELVCCSFRWSRWSGWPSWRRTSRQGCLNCQHRHRWWALPSRCWCCCPKPGPQSGLHSATGCRPV
jgi:Ca2+:H+ antiporter